MFTTTQKERLIELGASKGGDAVFEDAAARDAAFRDTEKHLVEAARAKVAGLLREKRMPDSAAVIRHLEDWLISEENFTKVTTPTIIPTEMLDRMTVTEDEPLREQIFYVGSKRCLRPMLAPNLYIMMRELGRIAKEPVRIFETGSCFRRESQGARHLNEFTMLNCVEYGVNYGEGSDGGAASAGVDSAGEGCAGEMHCASPVERLEGLARSAMGAVGIDHYSLEREESTVYGETIDIVVDGVELASCSYGPHPLDANWGVFAPWAGIGFGIERIAMVLGGHATIKRVGRSTSFIDGAPLNI
jgi:phenylalanyl-tRNA synthetase alpha chain